MERQLKRRAAELGFEVTKRAEPEVAATSDTPVSAAVPEPPGE